MFMGEYNHSVDAKGRVIIPAKFREKLGESFVVTKGLDGCLFGFDNHEWEKIQSGISNANFLQAETRQFARFFLAGAAECEVDKQGRILLPMVLRNFAQLEKDVVVVGVAARIEIWSKEKWLNITSQYDGNMDEIAAKMVEFGFSM